MTTEERVERLERELAAMRDGESIRATRFVLVDRQGRERGVWWTSEGENAPYGGPVLTLYDENGKERACLSVEADEPALTLRDEKGNIRANLTIWAGKANLDLSDESGQAGVSLEAARASGFQGEPGLSLYDEKGKVQVMIDHGGILLRVLDKGFNVRAELTLYTKDRVPTVEHPSLFLRDGEGGLHIILTEDLMEPPVP